MTKCNKDVAAILGEMVGLRDLRAAGAVLNAAEAFPPQSLWCESRRHIIVSAFEPRGMVVGHGAELGAWQVSNHIGG